jgi:hypothetical protein
MDYKLLGNRLPSSCCNRLLNGICMEVDSYRLGCFQIINEYIQLYSRLIVAIGIGIALLEVKKKISKTKFHFGFYF